MTSPGNADAADPWCSLHARRDSECIRAYIRRELSDADRDRCDWRVEVARERASRARLKPPSTQVWLPSHDRGYRPDELPADTRLEDEVRVRPRPDLVRALVLFGGVLERQRRAARVRKWQEIESAAMSLFRPDAALRITGA